MSLTRSRLSLIIDHLRQKHNAAFFADILDDERTGIPENPDESIFVNMPIVFPVCRLRPGRPNNTRIFVRRDIPSSYEDINNGISVAVDAHLWYTMRARMNNVRRAHVVRQLNQHMLDHGQMLFTWGIAGRTQAYLSNMRRIMPTPGTSALNSPFSADWGEIHVSHIPGRVSYIFVAFDIFARAEEIAGTGSMIVHQPQPDRDEEHGWDHFQGMASTVLPKTIAMLAQFRIE
ncbi:hypothetical protein F4678DRAFT_478356 [Xylaria arbuscula]|nr:hypothetical protein F4678DRAFT_478356 [Xylaria arbuscula]